MSVTVTKPESDTCSRETCETEFLIPNAKRGSYCSLECADRDDAESVLDVLSRAHDFCASCYKPKKVIYRPDEASTPALRRKPLLIRDAFVGFEDITRYAKLGDYGIECECGAVNHDLATDLCRDGEPYEWYLQLAVDHFRKKGKWEYKFDVETFCETFWQTTDFELATGKALYKDG